MTSARMTHTHNPQKTQCNTVKRATLALAPARRARATTRPQSRGGRRRRSSRPPSRSPRRTDRPRAPRRRRRRPTRPRVPRSRAPRRRPHDACRASGRRPSRRAARRSRAGTRPRPTRGTHASVVTGCPVGGVPFSGWVDRLKEQRAAFYRAVLAEAVRHLTPPKRGRAVRRRRPKSVVRRLVHRRERVVQRLRRHDRAKSTRSFLLPVCPPRHRVMSISGQGQKNAARRDAPGVLREVPADRSR